MSFDIVLRAPSNFDIILSSESSASAVMKYWNGSSWVTATVIKGWDGNSWETGVVRVWSGTEWYP